MNNDKLIIGGHEFNSRFILGSGKYSMKLIEAAVKDAGAEIITLAVRRAKNETGVKFVTADNKFVVVHFFFLFILQNYLLKFSVQYVPDVRRKS